MRPKIYTGRSAASVRTCKSYIKNMYLSRDLISSALSIIYLSIKISTGRPNQSFSSHVSGMRVQNIPKICSESFDKFFQKSDKIDPKSRKNRSEIDANRSKIGLKSLTIDLKSTPECQQTSQEHQRRKKTALWTEKKK